ncbi:MAG: hypothetical protein LUC22_03030 [Prevotella sp.]|nr:hypothetical protein [Prevotella sp.]
MAILNFASHTLDYLHIGQPSTLPNGDRVEGVRTWMENYCTCDVVPAGQANELTFADGRTERYSYTVYNLPRNCREFRYGDIIRIRFFGNEAETREFKVLGFARYQLQCKLWV